MRPRAAVAGLAVGALLAGSTDAYTVTVHFKANPLKVQPQTAAKTLYVYWTGGPSQVKPHVRNYTVTVLSVTTQDMLGALPGPSRLSFYGYVNEIGQPLGPATRTTREMPYIEGVAGTERLCPPPGTCSFALANNVFHVALVDGQPLHIEFRGISQTVLTLGTAHIGGTGEAIFTDDASGQRQFQWLGRTVPGFVATTWVGKADDLRAYGTMAIGPEAVDATCLGSCFTVRYEIQPT